MLVLYSTPFGKKASKATRLFFGMLIGYILIAVVSVFSAVFFGAGNGWGLYRNGSVGDHPLLSRCRFGLVVAADRYRSD